MASFPNSDQNFFFRKILHNMGSTICFDEKNIQTKFLRDLGHNSGKNGLNINKIYYSVVKRSLTLCSTPRCLVRDL